MRGETEKEEKTLTREKNVVYFGYPKESQHC